MELPLGWAAPPQWLNFPCATASRVQGFTKYTRSEAQQPQSQDISPEQRHPARAETSRQSSNASGFGTLGVSRSLPDERHMKPALLQDHQEWTWAFASPLAGEPCIQSEKERNIVGRDRASSAEAWLRLVSSIGLLNDEQRASRLQCQTFGAQDRYDCFSETLDSLLQICGGLRRPNCTTTSLYRSLGYHSPYHYSSLRDLGTATCNHGANA